MPQLYQPTASYAKQTLCLEGHHQNQPVIETLIRLQLSLLFQDVLCRNPSLFSGGFTAHLCSRCKSHRNHTHAKELSSSVMQSSFLPHPMSSAALLHQSSTPDLLKKSFYTSYKQTCLGKQQIILLPSGSAASTTYPLWTYHHLHFSFTVKGEDTSTNRVHQLQEVRIMEANTWVKQGLRVQISPCINKAKRVGIGKETPTALSSSKLLHHSL